MNEVEGVVTDAQGRVRHSIFGKWHESLFQGEPPAATCIWRAGEKAQEVGGDRERLRVLDLYNDISAAFCSQLDREWGGPSAVCVIVVLVLPSRRHAGAAGAVLRLHPVRHGAQ